MNGRNVRKIALLLACVLGSSSLSSCHMAEANYYFPATCRLPKWFNGITRPSVDVQVAAYINHRGRELVFDVYNQKHELFESKTASIYGLQPIWLTLANGTKNSFEVISADGVADVIKYVNDDPHGVSICTVDDPEIWKVLDVKP
jgi:hypothetical protein